MSILKKTVTTTTSLVGMCVLASRYRWFSHFSFEALLHKKKETLTMGNSNSHATPENVHKLLEGDAKTKLSITEAEIDDMVSRFSTEPPTRERANFQIAMTYVHKLKPYGALELYKASAPNPNPPGNMGNLGIVSDMGFWVERYLNRADQSTYFNILTISIKKGNTCKDIANYAIQPGDIIDLHPTSIMGDNVTLVHVDASNPKETVISMDFITKSKEEQEALLERFKQFKWMLVKYPFGITDLIPIGKEL